MKQLEKWTVMAKRADFYEIGKRFGIDPVIARVIRNRDVITEEEVGLYLGGEIEDLSDSHLLKDIDKAAEILAQKIERQKKIRIIGDYDIDGIQSSYILWEGIERLGGVAETVIPDRVKDGYGVNEHLVELAVQEGADTILTCDNGIAAAPILEKARQAGLTVIITDHHEIPFEEKQGQRKEILPKVDAIVNPKQQDCLYPYKALCGAVVAWHLIRVLYERMGRNINETDEFIENAAFATVGDVMELQFENRILVKEGLRRLNRTENIGMRALIQTKNLHMGAIRAYHIGFVLGPCLNASGRLDTAKKALLLLKTRDEVRAAELAEELSGLNEERKEMTMWGVEKAIADIERSGMHGDKILVSYLPDCHESIAGIIAGRIRERYNRPVYILTDSGDGAKGSGRSIENYSMYEELCKCSSLLEKFGGHPMAAGLSIQKENIDSFREQLNQNCELSNEDLIPKIKIDVPMPLDYLSESLIRQLELLEPFGKGNEKPVFADKNIRILFPRIVGKNKNVVKMRIETESSQRYEGVYFGEAQEFLQFLKERQEGISIVYYPQLNTYSGQTQIEIVVLHYR
ncbi:MAG: single-stranded-DNA-specific exonuclease RecJ [Lachnospiraceae bacterium]|nr:single-stranded-DNA-specific exonuclease RecJ [Lachnospiraceae bacterium]